MRTGPEELTLQALSPEQRDYSFYRQTVLLIGWSKLRGFVCMTTAVRMGRGMSDLDRHE